MSVRIYIHTFTEQNLRKISKSRAFEIKNFLIANREIDTRITRTHTIDFLIDYYLKNEKFPNAGVNYTEPTKSGEHYDKISSIVPIPEAWDLFRTSKCMQWEIKKLLNSRLELSHREAHEYIFEEFSSEGIDDVAGMWQRKDGRVEIEQERSVTMDDCEE